MYIVWHLFGSSACRGWLVSDSHTTNLLSGDSHVDMDFVARQLPVYLGFRESMRLRAVAQVIRVSFEKHSTVWNKLEITTNIYVEYKASFHEKKVVADMTVKEWNSMLPSFKVRMAEKVLSVIVHIHSEEELLEHWNIAESRLFLNLNAISLIASGHLHYDHGETGFFLPLADSEVSIFSIRLMAFVLSWPLSLKLVHINMRWMPTSVNDFELVERSVLPLFIEHGSRFLEGIAVQKVRQMSRLQAHHLSECIFFSILETLWDDEDVEILMNTVNSCRNLKRLKIAILHTSFKLLKDRVLEPSIEVLILGIESIKITAADLAQAKFIARSLEVLFLRFDISARTGYNMQFFLTELAACFRARGLHLGLWIFAMQDGVPWEILDIDVFSPLLERKRWKEPADLIINMNLPTSDWHFIEI